MKRNSEKGAAKFSSILIVALICYGAFAAIKIISANVMEGQIRNNIIDEIGLQRGPNFTAENARKIVREALKAQGVLENDTEYSEESTTESTSEANSDSATAEQIIYAEIDEKTSMVRFKATFNYTVNLIFFKQKKHYVVEGELLNYN